MTPSAPLAPSTTPGPTPLDPQALTIPESAGTVIARHAALGGGSAQTVILIKDAHVNVEAQRHLATIIDALARTHGLTLVCVEGGSGDVSLSYLRQSAPAQKRREVAEQFLKEGKFSGEEYLDLTVDYPLTLWGVEDPALYDEDLRLFLDTAATRDGLAPLIGRLRQALAPAKARRYPKPLQALEQAEVDYEAERMRLAEYVRHLRAQAQQAGVSLAPFTHLAAYGHAQEAEGALELAQVEREQAHALGQLKRRLTPESWQQLEAAGKAFEAGQSSPLAYYKEVERSLWKIDQGLEAYPLLAAYVRSLKAAEALNPAALLRELNDLAWRLKQRLTDTPEASALLALDRQLQLLEQLLALELTPAAFREFEAQRLDSAAWLQTASDTLTRERLTDAQWRQTLARALKAVPQLQRFYAVAHQRERAITAHVLDKLKETREPAAVLRLGGFHAERVAELLTDAGVNVVVISPTFSAATDEALYRKILRYKADLPIEDK